MIKGPKIPTAKTIGNPLGMTLRDYFAIRALCAMTSAPIGKFNHSNNNEAVSDAYVIADAMLAERNK